MTVVAGGAYTVLVVDDAADMRLVATYALEAQGFVVEQAEDGPAALARVAVCPPDLLVLDVNMPGMSGFEVMAEVRRRHPVPVILLTARGEESDRVVGLELGADDYVVKPFSTRELGARARAVLRRSSGRSAPRGYDFGPLLIRLAEREVLLHGRPVELTAKEFDLLAFLASSPPRQVFSRAELLERVWGSSSEWQDPSTVTEHVRRVRKKIEADPERPQWLQTVRGVGYRFDPSPPASLAAPAEAHLASRRASPAASPDDPSRAGR